MNPDICSASAFAQLNFVATFTQVSSAGSTTSRPAARLPNTIL
jgi:hypothetical protein